MSCGGRWRGGGRREGLAKRLSRSWVWELITILSLLAAALVVCVGAVDVGIVVGFVGVSVVVVAVVVLFPPLLIV